METPKGFISLSGLRLGTTTIPFEDITGWHFSGGPEIFLCPDGDSFVSGNLSVSGDFTSETITANTIRVQTLTADNITIPSSTIEDLHIPLGTPVLNHHSETRPIPLSKTVYTTDIGLNLSSLTHGTESFQLIDKYISTYLYETPPAVTLGTSSNTTTSFCVSWVNTPTIQSAFLPISLPHIKDIYIDIIKTSDNPFRNFPSISTSTIKLGSSTVTNSTFYTNSSTPFGLFGNSFNFNTILAQTLYDLRVYEVNYSQKPVNYFYFFDNTSATAGVPDVVTGITVSNISTTSNTTSFVAPLDHDTSTTGIQSLPTVSNYSIQTIPLSTSRYGGLYNTAINTSSTPTTSGVNSNTSLIISGLMPGTSYKTTVSAKNEININYGTTASNAFFSSNVPSAPNYLSTSSCNSFVNASNYVLAGSSFNGNLINEPIIRYNTPLQSINTPNIRLHEYPGAVGTSVSVVSAFGIGVSASLSISGFSGVGVSGDVINGSVLLHYNGITDAYNNTSSSGFWETGNFYVSGFNPSVNYLGSSNSYSLKLAWSSNLNNITTNPLKFYIDTINTIPTIIGPRITSEINSGWQYISGVPTFNTSAIFKYQVEMSGIAGYFLRGDKKHITTQIIDGITNGVSYSTINTISQPTITVSSGYFIGTSDVSLSSTSKFGGTGLVLTSNPGNIQFNEFTINLNSAGSVYTENFILQSYGFNLHGNSGGYTGGYTGKSLRIDTKSIGNTIGINHQVKSGSGLYPSISVTEAGSTYNHSDSLLSNSELQLINGVYQSVIVGNGYKNYSNYYFSGSPILRDYTSVISDNNYRYTTFKYLANEIGITSGITREKITVLINGMSGLLIDTTTPNSENHIFQIRILDIGDGSNINDTTTTGWMDACNVVNGVGVLYGTNGTGCLNQSTSTNSRRDIYLRNGTTTSAIIYIRIGIKNNLNAYFSNLSVTAVTTFS